MKIGIIDYGASNVKSVFNCLYNFGYNPRIINSGKEIKNLDKLIIPGVGSANLALKALNKNGLKDEIINFYQKEKFILGICLGFQIFANKLFEDGLNDGLQIIDGDVVKFSKNGINNIGWNDLKINDNSIIELNNDETCFYFCHSYFLKINSKFEEQNCVAEIKFNSKIVPSIYIKKNFFGTQFHPEKSQTNGHNLIQKFLTI